MSNDTKNGYGTTIALMLLGMLAMYGGALWLVILVPAAALVWHASTRAALRRGRN
jgi:hypothetical protein